MQLQVTLSAFLAVSFLGSLTWATPIPCPDITRDQILLGLSPPELCCSYGICKGDVVVQGG